MTKFAPKQFITKNGIEFSIRSAHAEDGESVLKFGKQIMKDSGKFVLTMPEELNLTVSEEAQWLKNMEDSPSNIALLAESQSEIIGFLDFSAGRRQRIAHTGEFGMSVKREYRRSGIGSALLDSLIEWTKSNPKIEKINLQVHATNDRAISLYKSKGFVIEGTRRAELKYGEDHYVDSILMAKWVKTDNLNL